MSRPIEDVIPTYRSDGGNLEKTSDIKADAGTLTRATADEPIKIVADDGLIVPSRTKTERDAIADPQDGSVLFNSTDKEINYYANNQWNGSASGNMYQVNNIVVTTINTKDVFEDVHNFVAGELKETTFASSILTTGNIQYQYMITYSACIVGSTNTTFEMAIKIDGVIRDESHSCNTIATGGSDVSMSGNFILTIGELKDIVLVMANKSSTSNAIVLDASVSIVRADTV